MDWYTADLHLGHKNIIRYAKRPFASVDEMDHTLINNINNVVQRGDRLFILGDLCGMRKKAKVIKDYLSRINLATSQFVYILGNHDDEKETRKVFPNCYHLHTTRDGEQRIVLCHYAMKVWHGSHRGTWHFYGHSHGTLKDDPRSQSLDVGVDCWEMKPVNLKQISEKMKLKTWAPIDHHGMDDLNEEQESCRIM